MNIRFLLLVILISLNATRCLANPSEYDCYEEPTTTECGYYCETLANIQKIAASRYITVLNYWWVLGQPDAIRKGPLFLWLYDRITERNEIFSTEIEKTVSLESGKEQLALGRLSHPIISTLIPKIHSIKKPICSVYNDQPLDPCYFVIQNSNYNKENIKNYYINFESIGPQNEHELEYGIAAYDLGVLASLDPKQNNLMKPILTQVDFSGDLCSDYELVGFVKSVEPDGLSIINICRKEISSWIQSEIKKYF